MSQAPFEDDPPELWHDAEAQLRFFQRAVRARLHGRGTEEDVEDLAMRCWIRLHRYLSRERPERIGAVMNQMARFEVIDSLPGLARRTASLDDPDALPGWQPTVPPPSLTLDHIERIRFIVVQHFRNNNAVECAEIALTRFEERAWDEVARLRRSTTDRVKKRWERCLDRLETAVEENQDGLGELRIYWEILRLRTSPP